jgi:hypothetical protein
MNRFNGFYQVSYVVFRNLYCFSVSRPPVVMDRVVANRYWKELDRVFRANPDKFDSRAGFDLLVLIDVAN